MTDNSIQLDEAAAQLFQQFEGIETYEKANPPAMVDGLAESLVEEQKQQDTWRILLIDMVHLIGAYYLDINFLDNHQAEQATFKQLATTFKKLSQLPANDGKVLIRYRGFPSETGTPEKYDYEILFGHLRVDTAVVTQIIKRQGFRFSHLSDQLLRSFAVFSDHGLNNMLLRLPSAKIEDFKLARTCLHILVRFKEAMEKNIPIEFNHRDQRCKVAIMRDERGRADANLTLVAGLNRLNSDATAKLVKKVDAWMRQKAVAKPGFQYAGVYNALFQFKQVREKLVHPPFEVNNVKWLMVSNDTEAIPERKAQLAQLIVDNSQGSAQKVAKVLTSVYGNDFDRITSKHLGERLHLSSDLLNSIDQQPAEQHLRAEVIGNVTSRLQTVKDEVFDDLFVNLASSSNAADGDSGVAQGLNQRLHGMITFFKLRSSTRKKMRAMIHQAMQFNQRDYDVLAKDFRISTAEAQDIVADLKSCFGEKGEFNKTIFAGKISKFIKFENKIFEFLWHHLKDAIRPEDRIAFLNSLQTLTAKMNQPKRAFKILLEDFHHDPATVNFSDSKALMLANLVLRQYDKSLADFEITPEDIIHDRSSLDKNVANYATWRIDKEQERFFEKVRTIHQQLFEALQLGKTRHLQLTPADLLALERESFIFLALVGGTTARSVIRSAIKEYGSPDSALYGGSHSPSHLMQVLQNLRLAIRALGVIGEMDGLALLDEVLEKQEVFIHTIKDRACRTKIRNLHEWVSEAQKQIKFRA
jgi:hypothetical protein